MKRNGHFLLTEKEKEMGKRSTIRTLPSRKLNQDHIISL